MTDEELKAIEARHKEAFDLGDMRLTHDTDVPELLAEVRRLRGLLQSVAEDDGAPSHHCCPTCPWCDGDVGPNGGRFTHTEKCPAYTVEGQVR